MELMALQLLPAKTNCLTRVKETDQESLKKSLQPKIDFLIDVQTFLQWNGFQLFQYLKTQQFFLTPKNSQIQDVVWLHINTQENKLVFELSDPYADDLIMCNQVFARVIKYSRGIASLEEFCAPSFKGTRAMELIKKIMALTKIHELILRDQSITLPCCKDGALTSLSLIEIFKSGKSWYQICGATSKVSSLGLKMILCEAVEESYTKDICSPKDNQSIISSNEFDHYYFHYRTRYVPETNDRAEKAYSYACRYIFSLSCRIPCLETTINVRNLLSSSSFLSKESDQHDKLHFIRDCIIANKDSESFQNIALKLKINASNFSTNLITLSFLVLDYFFRKCFEFGVPTRRLIQVIHRQLIMNEEQEDLTNEFGSITRQISDNILEQIEIAFDSPVNVKIKKHSNFVNRKKWIYYSEETGKSNDVLAPKAAMQYLASLPLNEFKNMCPDFFNDRSFPTFYTNICFGKFLSHLVDLEGFLNKFITKIGEHLLSFSIQVFENAHIYSQDELLIIAKYLCNRQNLVSIELKSMEDERIF